MPSVSWRSLRDVVLLLAMPRRAAAPLLAAAALYGPGPSGEEVPALGADRAARRG